MTLLFGCTCNQPQHLATALEPVRHSLVLEAPVIRWGLGYVQTGEVLLKRHPRLSEQPVYLYANLQGVRSDYVIGHSADDDGLRGNANTQPFRFRHWMFAQQGSIQPFDELRQQLLEHTPNYLRRNIKGKTSAEYVFHLFLSFLHDAGTLDDPNVKPMEVRRVLRDTLALVFGEITKLGGDSEAASGNAVVSNGRSMLALRIDTPLYMRRLKIPPAKGKAHNESGDSFRGVMALSSDAPLEQLGEGFEEIPPRSVLVIHRDLRTDIVSLDA